MDMYRFGQYIGLCKLAGDVPSPPKREKTTPTKSPTPVELPSMSDLAPQQPRFASPQLDRAVNAPMLSTGFESPSDSTGVAPKHAKRLFDFLIPTAMQLEEPGDLTRGKFTFGKSFTF